VAVEESQQDQHQPDRFARHQDFGLAQGQRPGDRGGRRDLARGHPDLLPPAQEVLPVVLAGQSGIGDHRRSLGQRQRLTAERFDQVDRTLALGGIHAQPFGHAAEGLADAEEPDRVNLRPAPPGYHAGVRAGDDEPTGRPFRPEAFHFGDIRQIIEYHQPRPVGGGEPVDEARRDRFGRPGRLDARRRHRRLRVAGQHRRPAGGGDPDQDVDGARSP
jgi:hypothetical protein